MPRPRIRPEDRQRAVKACIPCKSAKKRCDSQIPCAPCVRRGCPLSCLYHDGRRTATRPSSQISPQSSYIYPDSNIHDGESMARCNETGSRILPMQNPHEVTNPGMQRCKNVVREQENQTPVQRSDGNATHNLDTIKTGPATTQKVALPQSRLMLNARGEKVYVGNAAALAFLQFLRQILSQHMGPSQFTENSRGNVMLEAQSLGEIVSEVEQDPQMNRRLINKFFLATSGVIDLCSRTEMDCILTAVETKEMGEDLNEAIVCLALAIGQQCNCLDDMSTRQMQKHFALSQKLAFDGMLEDPSIKLIKVFLLMAFYLLGGCRRNAAFMYIGIAARAAHALGIHEADPNYVLSTDEYHSRLRIWKSLRILDVMVSSILGRPFASTSLQIHPCARSTASRNRGSSKAVDVNFELCSIIEDVITHIGQQSQLDTISTQELLKRLTQWSVTLPSEIRLCSIKQSIVSSNHGLVIGSMHVACLYYFTLMLLTRPFLIQHLVSKLSKVSNKPTTTAEVSDTSEQDKIAEVCIDAAMFMAQICQNALSANLLLDNMCILKAWIFGAGLVIGFTIFANVEVSPDMESAFSSSRDVLKRFSVSSQQAEHYYEVLESFSQAITKRREHIARERRRTISQYVDQILVMDFQGNQGQQCNTPASPIGVTDSTRFEADNIEDWWNLEFPLAEGILDNAPDVLTADWDAFALQIQENFVADTELFSPERPADLFDTI